MLILSRRIGELIVIPGLDVEVKVLGVQRGKVRLGIQAPGSVIVRRLEVPLAPPTSEEESPPGQLRAS
jgi:carbon storage regulator